jgi:hypothetical protein
MTKRREGGRKEEIREKNKSIEQEKNEDGGTFTCDIDEEGEISTQSLPSTPNQSGSVGNIFPNAGASWSNRTSSTVTANTYASKVSHSPSNTTYMTPYSRPPQSHEAVRHSISVVYSFWLLILSNVQVAKEGRGVQPQESYQPRRNISRRGTRQGNDVGDAVDPGGWVIAGRSGRPLSKVVNGKGVNCGDGDAPSTAGPTTATAITAAPAPKPVVNLRSLRKEQAAQALTRAQQEDTSNFNTVNKAGPLMTLGPNSTFASKSDGEERQPFLYTNTGQNRLQMPQSPAFHAEVIDPDSPEVVNRNVEGFLNKLSVEKLDSTSGRVSITTPSTSSHEICFDSYPAPACLNTKAFPERQSIKIIKGQDRTEAVLGQRSPEPQPGSPGISGFDSINNKSIIASRKALRMERRDARKKWVAEENMKKEKERTKEVDAEKMAKQGEEMVEAVKNKEEQEEKEHLEKATAEKERLLKGEERVKREEAERLHIVEEEANKATQEAKAATEAASKNQMDGEVTENQEESVWETLPDIKKQGEAKPRDNLQRNTSSGSVAPVDLLRKRPGPLDLSSASKYIFPSLPSALATARIIDDIGQITYPEGIKSPKVELNINAKGGKFKLVVCLSSQGWVANAFRVGEQIRP